MGQPLFNSLGILVITTFVTLMTTWFWRNVNKLEREKLKLAEEREVLEEKVRSIEMQLGQVGQAIVPINAAFQAILIKQLTHFHTPRMDELMVKLGPPITLTKEEEKELFIALKAREKEVDELIDGPERDAAHMLPLVMKRVKAESEAISNAPSQLKVVAVAPNDVVEPGPVEAQPSTPPAAAAVEAKESAE